MSDAQTHRDAKGTITTFDDLLEHLATTADNSDVEPGKAPDASPSSSKSDLADAHPFVYPETHYGAKK